MIPSFPDPAVQTEYEYLNNEGLTIKYTWDGEKWLASGVETGPVNTRQVALINAINSFADVLPPLESLETQEDYNKYVYDGVKYLFDNGSPADTDGGIYNPVSPDP